MIHSSNYVHHDLHSGNILLSSSYFGYIADLGLCQQVNKSDDPDEIVGVIPYIAPEVFLKKPYTVRSDMYSFGMIMWGYTSGQKPFHDKSHDHHLICDILRGLRPEILEDTPEFYAELMKKCWDPDPEKRPTAETIINCLDNYYYQGIPEKYAKEIRFAESKRQELIKSEKYLTKNHPEAIYTSRSLKKIFQ